MIKDEFRIPPLKLSYTILILGVIALVIFQLFQSLSTSKLRIVNKQLTEENETIENLNIELSKQSKLDSLKVVEYEKTNDSLILLDKRRVYQLNKINQKYEKITIDYNSAITDVRWNIFTKLIDN